LWCVFIFLLFQAGCCKPPVYCGFTMKNATYWEVPKSGLAANNSDCATWNNRQEKLCYDCNACKGGVLANIRNQWRHLTVFNGFVLVLVTAIYAMGCYAIRNNRLDSRSNLPWLVLCLQFVIRDYVFVSSMVIFKICVYFVWSCTLCFGSPDIQFP